MDRRHVIAAAPLTVAALALGSLPLNAVVVRARRATFGGALRNPIRGRRYVIGSTMIVDQHSLGKAVWQVALDSIEPPTTPSEILAAIGFVTKVDATARLRELHRLHGEQGVEGSGPTDSSFRAASLRQAQLLFPELAQ